MHAYLTELITVTSIFLLVLITPGPDFVLVARNSLIYSRRTGMFSAAGVAFGILVHVTYSLFGLGLLISQSIILFSVLKFLGALYLIYIGYKSLRAKPNQVQISTNEQQVDLTPYQAIKNGFLTNVLNPKVTLLFLALFTQVIHTTTPFAIKLGYGLEMSLLVLLWYTMVAVLLSDMRVKKPFLKIQHYIERTTGAILIALGLKIALSHK